MAWSPRNPALGNPICTWRQSSAASTRALGPKKGSKKSGLHLPPDECSVAAALRPLKDASHGRTRNSVREDRRRHPHRVPGCRVGLGGPGLRPLRLLKYRGLVGLPSLRVVPPRLDDRGARTPVRSPWHRHVGSGMGGRISHDRGTDGRHPRGDGRGGVGAGHRLRDRERRGLVLHVRRDASAAGVGCHRSRCPRAGDPSAGLRGSVEPRRLRGLVRTRRA